MRGRRPLDREALVAEHATGRTFLDVGAMWSVHGQISFVAEQAGATAVTALDVMPASATYEERHAAESSAVRFVQGDLHDVELEPHDVVWCSGVLYHVPHPLLTLERLHALTTDTLILATEIATGRGRHAIFDPGPRDHPNLEGHLDPAKGYVGWWWLPTADAVLALLRTAGFAPGATHRTKHHLTVVARKTESRPGIG